MLRTSLAFLIVVTWIFHGCHGFGLKSANGSIGASYPAAFSFLAAREGVSDGSKKSSGAVPIKTLACPLPLPVVPLKRPGDSTLLGIVSSLPADSIRKHDYIGLSHAVIVIARDVRWPQLKHVLKKLAEPGSRCKVTSKYQQLIIDKHTNFGDPKAFPQTTARIVPTGVSQRLHAEPQKGGADDLAILLFEIAHDCKMSAVQATITNPLTVLFKDIPTSHVTTRGFSSQAPHFLLQNRDYVDLLLTIDRSWCGQGLRHLVQFHVNYPFFSLEVNGKRVDNNATFEDERLYPQVILSSKFEGKTHERPLTKSRSLPSLMTTPEIAVKQRPHSVSF
uniref:ROP15 protein, related n=1 Tax=Neospora caninum (strain Liverpool) TaxID=572307 RepID=A0A0F7U690_NEOCL|nr:TPA: ROP15 protein, related [Neospora caninum Liverpool]